MQPVVQCNLMEHSISSLSLWLLGRVRTIYSAYFAPMRNKLKTRVNLNAIVLTLISSGGRTRKNNELLITQSKELD